MTDATIETDVAETVNDETDNMYLTFFVGNELYGIEIRYVLQIIGMQEIYEMPDTPPGMKGFINLRGNVVPAVSMRFWFKKAEDAYTDRTCIIVVQVGETRVGLIVDAIQETISIDPKDVSPPPSIGKERAAPFIIGIARLQDVRNAVLVHAQKLFDEQILKRREFP